MPRDHLQWIGTDPSWVMGPPAHLKTFNPEMFLSKGKTGTKMEQRLKKGPSRDCPTWGSILSADIKPWHCCCFQEAFAVRNLVRLFPGRFCQHLTNADLDAWSQPSDWVQGPQWGSWWKNWRSRGWSQPHRKNSVSWLGPQFSQKLYHPPRSIQEGDPWLHGYM